MKNFCTKKIICCSFCPEFRAILGDHILTVLNGALLETGRLEGKIGFCVNIRNFGRISISIYLQNGTKYGQKKTKTKRHNCKTTSRIFVFHSKSKAISLIKVKLKIFNK